MKKILRIVKYILLPLAVGGLSAFLSKEGMKEFQNVNQPPLSPPQWLFPVAWTILYAMMGYADYLISQKNGEAVKESKMLYYLQLVVNFFWTPMFFVSKWYLLAFFWLIILWILVYACIRSFNKVDVTASRLMVPYLVWLTFAAYLNFGVYLLN